MNGFLIKNKEVAETMLKYFDLTWSLSPCIHAGKVVKKEGLDEIVRVDSNLKNDTNYLCLSKVAESYL